MFCQSVTSCLSMSIVLEKYSGKNLSIEIHALDFSLWWAASNRFDSSRNNCQHIHQPVMLREQGRKWVLAHFRWCVLSGWGFFFLGLCKKLTTWQINQALYSGIWWVEQHKSEDSVFYVDHFDGMMIHNRGNQQRHVHILWRLAKLALCVMLLDVSLCQVIGMCRKIDEKDFQQFLSYPTSWRYCQL